MNPRPADEGICLSSHSRFHLASFTKILVATLVIQQMEQGAIGLERPVSAHIPEFAQRGKEVVTVRHLIAHASGLADEIAIPVLADRPIGEFVGAICAEPLVFVPGSRGSYCTWATCC